MRLYKLDKVVSSRKFPLRVALVGDFLQCLHFWHAGFGRLWFGSDLRLSQWLSLLDLLRLWRIWAPCSPIIVSRLAMKEPWREAPRGVQFEIEFGIILLQLLLAAHLFSCYWVLLGHYEQQIWGLQPWTELSCGEQYWAAFYFSTYTLTSILKAFQRPLKGPKGVARYRLR